MIKNDDSSDLEQKVFFEKFFLQKNFDNFFRKNFKKKFENFLKKKNFWKIFLFQITRIIILNHFSLKIKFFEFFFENF